MAFDSFADFLAMGKHGPYVWSAYGLTAVAMLWLTVQTLSERKRFFREQYLQMKREAQQQRGTQHDEPEA